MAKTEKKKVKLPNSTSPYSEGDRVVHEMFGEGTVHNVHRTGGGLWSTYVEFDEPHDRIRGRYAPIASSWLAKAPESEEPDDG